MSCWQSWTPDRWNWLSDSKCSWRLLELIAVVPWILPHFCLQLMILLLSSNVRCKKPRLHFELAHTRIRVLAFFACKGTTDNKTITVIATSTTCYEQNRTKQNKIPLHPNRIWQWDRPVPASEQRFRQSTRTRFPAILATDRQSKLKLARPKSNLHMFIMHSSSTL